LIALHGGKTLFHQDIRCACCFEWAANMITKVHHLADAIGGNIGENGLQREAISVYIGNGSEPHWKQRSGVGRPMTISCGKHRSVRFSCTCRSARELIVKSALHTRISVALQLSQRFILLAEHAARCQEHGTVWVMNSVRRHIFASESSISGAR
jgi:hypothetical protein